MSSAINLHCSIHMQLLKRQVRTLSGAVAKICAYTEVSERNTIEHVYVPYTNLFKHIHIYRHINTYTHKHTHHTPYPYTHFLFRMRTYTVYFIC
ncbi:hypothetical protein EON63_07150 [archaeon]|nr:MAG: hypothetical protein EON63_07150 [archaeon]